MTVLTDIVSNIITLALIFACLELFLPKGELSRFVRLGCAVIMLAMIILPAISGLEDTRWEWPKMQEAADASADYKKEAQALTGILEAEAMSIYEQDAAESISATAAMADGVVRAKAAVTADDTGAITHIDIYAEKEAAATTASAKQNIREILEQYYRISARNIQISIGEATNE